MKELMKIKRVETGFLLFTLLYSLLSLLIYHIPFFEYLSANLDILSFEGGQVLVTTLLVFYSLTSLFLALLYLFSKCFMKFICCLLLCCNAAVLFFIINYNVEIDKVMVANIFNTRYSEAIELVQGNFILYFLFLGVIPSYFVSQINIGKVTRLKAIVHSFLLLIVVMPLLYLMSGSWLWIDKHASKVGSLLLPWAYVVDTTRYGLDKYQNSRTQELLPAPSKIKNGKMVGVLVIGETARKHNFSLYGYDKLTSPLLEQAGVVALNNTTACATYTTASLSCILSHTIPSNMFTTQYEPLPSYLSRHGVDVIWRTNNWGEPPLKVNSYTLAETLRKNCSEEYCQYDGVLLRGLKERIENSPYDKVLVVLHQKGSHGPSYYLKYPKRFEYFQPVCKSLDVNKCTYEELVNAYDNTILYTDYLLSNTISMLKELGNIPSMMMYISDHGESLGEYGLYLHGTPYSVAPKFQTEIPFLFWGSKAFLSEENIQLNNFKQNDSYSHSNVFHSILGAYGIDSSIYNQELDIFSTEKVQYD